MKKLKENLILLVLLSFTTVMLTACNQNAQVENQFEKTVEYATERAEAILGVPGITIALIDAESGFTWAQGFGYADTINSIPVTADTVFMIGSISKPFTAITVMQFVEEGLIDLDEPIITYLPDFNILPHPTNGGDYRNITTRMILNHTAGLPRDYLDETIFTIENHDEAFLNNFLTSLSTETMIAEEGTGVSYSNVGFVILGILVARVAGYDNHFEGFVNYTNEFLFEPLGLNRTSFVMNDEIVANSARPYVNHRLQYEGMAFANALPTGSMVTSANEMAVLMHTLLGDIKFDNGQFLQQESFNQMIDFDDGFSYHGRFFGLGFFQRVESSHIGHDGGILGFRSEMIFDLDTGIGVFVTVNSQSGDGIPFLISEEILQHAINEKMGR